jgi:methylated-DNA-[protein]-cysteine S-methyltransferase
MTTLYLRFPSRLGEVTLTGDGRALTGFFYGGQKYHPPIGGDWRLADDDALLREVREQYLAYEQGRLCRFEVTLDLHGTPFQQRVWQALLEVGYGQTISYGELSRRIATPSAVRAVGAAVGRNPVSVIVPCHRIVGSNGSLTGYAGGLDRKRELLMLEGALLV